MWGFIIALISGALMSIQGVFNTEVTKSSSVWAAADCFFCLRNSMVYNRKTKCCGNVSNGKQVYAVRRRYRSIYYFNGN